MPRKRRILPHPCPICKRENGTIQLALTYGGIIVRIGHYSSKLRNSEMGSWKIRDMIKRGKRGSEKEFSKEDKKHILWKTERKWCSFRSGATLVLGNISGGFIARNEPPSCFSPPERFIKEVIRYGWDLEPNSKHNYKGRVRKNIDYFEKQIKSS